MATIMYDGKQIAGGGVSIVHMTEQQYLQNKTALDASDLLIEITDKDYPVEADNIGFTPPTGMSATNVQDAVEEVNGKVNRKAEWIRPRTGGTAETLQIDLTPYMNGSSCPLFVIGHYRGDSNTSDRAGIGLIFIDGSGFSFEKIYKMTNITASWDFSTKTLTINAQDYMTFALFPIAYNMS